MFLNYIKRKAFFFFFFNRTLVLANTTFSSPIHPSQYLSPYLTIYRWECGNKVLRANYIPFWETSSILHLTIKEWQIQFSLTDQDSRFWKLPVLKKDVRLAKQHLCRIWNPPWEMGHGLSLTTEPCLIILFHFRQRKALTDNIDKHIPLSTIICRICK